VAVTDAGTGARAADVGLPPLRRAAAALLLGLAAGAVAAALLPRERTAPVGPGAPVPR
jgi:hypothetical protein